MNMTTAITIFAKKMTREKRIPFEVSVDPFYSESNMAHLHRGGWKHSMQERVWNTTSSRWTNEKRYGSTRIEEKQGESKLSKLEKEVNNGKDRRNKIIGIPA